MRNKSAGQSFRNDVVILRCLLKTGLRLASNRNLQEPFANCVSFLHYFSEWLGVFTSRSRTLHWYHDDQGPVSLISRNVTTSYIIFVNSPWQVVSCYKLTEVVAQWFLCYNRRKRMEIVKSDILALLEFHETGHSLSQKQNLHQTCG